MNPDELRKFYGWASPPGTQFDLFNATPDMARRGVATAPAPGPTLQSVLQADPRQISMPLKGRNPLVDMSIRGQQSRTLPRLDIVREGPVVQEVPQGRAPTIAGPRAPQQTVAPQVTLRAPMAPPQIVTPRVVLQGPMAPPQTVLPRIALNGGAGAPAAAAASAPAASAAAKAAPVDEVAEIAQKLAGKASRLPKWASNALSGGGGGAVMPLSLQEITDVTSGQPNAEQDAMVQNIKAAGAGVAEAWRQKGLDPTVKALFQGAKRIAFGAPGAEATPAPVADTSPTREGTLQELLAMPAPVAAPTPVATAAPTTQPNILTPFEIAARANPNMNLRQMMALANALPATSTAGAAGAAPSRGTALATERAIASLDREWQAMMINPKLTEAEKVQEDRRLRLEYATLANVQAGLFAPPNEE